MQLKSYTKEYLFGNRLVKPNLKLTQHHDPPLSSLYKYIHFLSNSSFSHSLYTPKQTSKHPFRTKQASIVESCSSFCHKTNSNVEGTSLPQSIWHINNNTLPLALPIFSLIPHHYRHFTSIRCILPHQPIQILTRIFILNFHSFSWKNIYVSLSVLA